MEIVPFAPVFGGFFGCLKTRHPDEIVDLAHFIVTLINVGNLDGEHESHLTFTGGGNICLDRLGIFFL